MNTYKFVFKGRSDLLKVLDRRLSSLDRVIMDAGLGSEFRFLPALFHTVVPDAVYDLFKDEGLLYDCHEWDGNDLIVSAHGSMSSLFVDRVNSSSGLGVFWTMIGSAQEFKSGVLLPNDAVQQEVLGRLGVSTVLAAEFAPVPNYSVDAVQGLKRGHYGLAIHLATRRFCVYTFAGDADEFQLIDIVTGIEVPAQSASMKDEMVLLPHSERLQDYLCTALYLGKLAEGELPDFMSALSNWVDPELLKDAFRNLV